MGGRWGRGRPGRQGRAAGAVAALLVAALVAVAVDGCADRPVSASQRQWAEQANLVVARVNDAVALHLLVGMLGESRQADGTMTTAPGGGPSWEEISTGCTMLDQVGPDIRQLVSSAPARFTKAASDLQAYGKEMAAVSTACHAAVAARSLATIRAESTRLDQATHDLDRLAAQLPHGLGCPPDVTDRPASCTAPKAG